MCPSSNRRRYSLIIVFPLPILLYPAESPHIIICFRPANPQGVPGEPKTLEIPVPMKRRLLAIFVCPDCKKNLDPETGSEVQEILEGILSCR